MQHTLAQKLWLKQNPSYLAPGIEVGSCIFVNSHGTWYVLDFRESNFSTQVEVSTQSGTKKTVKLINYINEYYTAGPFTKGSAKGWCVQGKLWSFEEVTEVKAKPMNKKWKDIVNKFTIGSKWLYNTTADEDWRNEVWPGDKWITVTVSDVDTDNTVAISFDDGEYYIDDLEWLENCVKPINSKETKTKENKTMANKKTTKARVTEAVQHGSKVAVADEAANVLLSCAKKLNNPMVDAALATPEGRSVVKLLMAIGVTACVNADIIPGFEGKTEATMAACDLVTEAAARDLLQSSLQQVIPELETLAKVGAKLVAEKLA